MTDPSLDRALVMLADWDRRLDFLEGMVAALVDLAATRQLVVRTRAETLAPLDLAARELRIFREQVGGLERSADAMEPEAGGTAWLKGYDAVTRKMRDAENAAEETLRQR